KPLGASTPQAPWMMWATFRASGFTVRPVSSYNSRTAVSVMGSPGSLLPTGRSHMPWANLAFSLRWRRTTRLVVLSWTMTAATSRVIDSRAGLRAFGWPSVWWATVFPSSGGLLGMLGERLAGAAGEIGGAGYFAPLVDREGGADRGDRL